jgi:uncharacterized protein involved in exopolysaccharide biosynthesis
MNTDNESQGTFRDLLYVIFKHKAKMITIFLTVVVTVTIGSFLMSPVYEASSKILVKFGRENVFMPTNPAVSGSPPVLFDSSREERINSEVEILKGRNLIEKVLSALGVTHIYPDIDKKPLIPRPSSSKKLSPLEKATLVFEKKLTAEGVKKSDIIDIKFQHKDPIIASQVVNKLIEVFLEHHLIVYKQSQKYDFFDDQVRLLETKLKESENELETFRTQNNISSLEEQKTLLLKQVSDIELELAKTRSEISENEGKMQALMGHPSATPTDVKMGEETDLNPYAMSAIRSKLAELKLKEEELLGKYTEQSVFVVNIRKEIKKAQELLAKEEKTYHDKAVTSISHNLNALRSKEESHKKHLSNYQQELIRINSVELKLKGLERQVKLNEENYQLYVKNMEEARISNAMDNQKIANISVVEPALPPIKPVKPRKLLNIILSIILGGVTALGVAFTSEYFGHSFNNSEDVNKHLGLPVLAYISEIK